MEAGNSRGRVCGRSCGEWAFHTQRLSHPSTPTVKTRGRLASNIGLSALYLMGTQFDTWNLLIFWEFKSYFEKWTSLGLTLAPISIRIGTGTCQYSHWHWHLSVFALALAPVSIRIGTGTCQYSHWHWHLSVFALALAPISIRIGTGTCQYSHWHWHLSVFALALAPVSLHIPQPTQ